MKSSVTVATVMSLLSAALADDFNLVCWGTSVPDNIQRGDLEWAIKNRVTELGVPGGTTFPYKFHTCTDLENKSHEIAVIVTPTSIVLVTGINGYVGGRTVEALLKAGYRVRGTVRSIPSAQATVEALAGYEQNLEIVEVADTSVPGAFDEVTKGVEGIAHLAQPVTDNFGSDPQRVISQIRDATTGLLGSATKVGSIKTVVLMSSAVAVFSPKDHPYIYTERDWSDSWVEIVRQMGAESPPGLPYLASKVVGERSFWKFRDERKPSFTMTAINPFFVSGPPLTTPKSPSNISSSCMFIWRYLNGEELVGPMPDWDYWVDVRDVAKLVAWAFDHGDEADGERYISKTTWAPPQATADILRPAYPTLSIKQGRPGEGYLPGWKTPRETDVDGSKALRVIGGDYVPYDQSVLDTAKSFEPLMRKL
ncbi:hypothetical protein KHU50_009563 [Colletotrichum sp. SAR 10_65]|nr:hypothetical protein KHU50_009563 [Colletotrichum sp. SAR 10_65]KAI8211892.1 hypothetical protein K4K52_009238 [Colletotrichum sp. SAR 10_76]KAJ5004747.1 hypothetical protein K4K48_008979 [Colletotrichum sp. SAR 10_66]